MATVDLPNLDAAAADDHCNAIADEALLGTLSRTSLAGRLWIGALAALCFTGLTAYVYQLRVGLAATAMTDYFSWGIYIVNFEFFIGISLAGTLISAILRLNGANWRGPIVRLAEAITPLALLVAGPMIIIDLGRPDRFFYTLIYGRLQSPILWDVLALATYTGGSLLYLYLPMIPDMALLRDSAHPFSPSRRRLYRALAFGWIGSAEQHRLLQQAISIMVVVILPGGILVLSVTAWLFEMTLRPGWHSTIIGPDTVVGALYSGIAAVTAAVALFRRFFRLESRITTEHCRRLSRLMLLFGIAYAYFVVNEHLASAYTSRGSERHLEGLIFSGSYAVQFWAMVTIGLFAPLLLLVLPTRRHIAGIVPAALLVNVGMWLKRYIIVVPTLASPMMPPVAGRQLSYVPTLVEWSITIGAFAAFCLLCTLFAKIFPIVSMWEAAATLEPSKSTSGAQDHARASVISALAPVLATALLITVAATHAGAQSTQPALAKISLSQSAEEGKPLIVASVTVGSKPIEDVTVVFRVRRSFGELSIGTEKTLDDGTAAIAFPADLRSESDGKLHVSAAVAGGAKYASARAEASFKGAALAMDRPALRALAASRAPKALIGAVLTLVAIPWLAYIYVARLLFRLRKAGNP